MEGGGGPAGRLVQDTAPAASPQPPVWLSCPPRGDGAGLHCRQGWDRDLAGSPLQPCLAAGTSPCSHAWQPAPLPASIPGRQPQLCHQSPRVEGASLLEDSRTICFHCSLSFS